jgi:methylated-DNA-[protein]-cysteine S-methyltransferase
MKRNNMTGATDPTTREQESCLTVETAIGTVVMVWTGRGLRRLELPAGATDLPGKGCCTGAGQAEPHAVPVWVSDLAGRIVDHLSGKPRDLQDIPLDLDGAPPFFRRVWERVRSVPAGSTTTYGAIATALGSPGAARAVGQAMARNPNLLVVPCHRVMGVAGPGGFSAAGGVDLKMHILALESAAAGGGSSTPRKD